MDAFFGGNVGGDYWVLGAPSGGYKNPIAKPTLLFRILHGELIFVGHQMFYFVAYTTQQILSGIVFSL